MSPGLSHPLYPTELSLSPRPQTSPPLLGGGPPLSQGPRGLALIPPFCPQNRRTVSLFPSPGSGLRPLSSPIWTLSLLPGLLAARLSPHHPQGGFLSPGLTCAPPSPPPNCPGPSAALSDPLEALWPGGDPPSSPVSNNCPPRIPGFIESSFRFWNGPLPSHWPSGEPSWPSGASNPRFPHSPLAPEGPP